MPVYDFTFVRWIKAPNVEIVKDYLKNNNIVGDLTETPMFQSKYHCELGDSMTREDGVDLILDENGNVVEGKL